MEKKRNIVVYGIFLIFRLIIFLILYFALSKMSMLTTLTVNLIIPTIVLFGIAVALNFNEKSNIKTCFIHALILTALTFIISMTTGELIENKHKDFFGSLNQENIGDWLDQQARKYMIEQGLIDEDDVIYSKPFMGEEHIPSLEADGELHAEWEVQMVEQTPMGVAVDTLFNFVVSFLGGFLAVKLWNIRSKKDNIFNPVIKN